MIPGTLAGLVLFAASLGPGFIYVTVADRRRPRPGRSSLGEAVEMVAIGGLCSACAAMVVLTVGKATGAFDTRRLQDAHYLFDHPARALGAIAAFLGLAYTAAWGLALLMHLGSDADHTPGGTAWQRHLWAKRPTTRHLSVVTVELRDGRKCAGVLAGFTSQLDESRELALVAPIAMTAHKGGALVKTRDAFLLLREQDILYVAGRYHP